MATTQLLRTKSTAQPLGSPRCSWTRRLNLHSRTLTTKE
jgi:hypothetical protein